MAIWRLNGTDTQRLLVKRALTLCDFPFELLKVSLAAEGKEDVAVDWEDLSARAREGGDGEGHSHEGGHAHTVERRGRVLGLFYLPPYTRVVLDVSLVGDANLAAEVFLSEAAHAVDYHYLTVAMRRAFWNAVHVSAEDLVEGADVPESGDISHGHSWFDGPAGYSTWVGEAFMEGFVRAFAPTVPVTIKLAHLVTPEAAAETRRALLPPPEASEDDKRLALALRRYLKTIWPKKYVREAAQPWLEARRL